MMEGTIIQEIWIKVMELREEVDTLRHYQILCIKKFQLNAELKYYSEMNNLRNSMLEKLEEIAELESLARRRMEGQNRRKISQ